MMKRSSRIAAMMECRHVGKVLQTYLDGEADELTARRVALHLDACRRCGFEFRTYRELKTSLRRRGAPLDEFALARLRSFASGLVTDPPTAGPGTA
jgi:anti-sigma factor RsiW